MSSPSSPSAPPNTPASNLHHQSTPATNTNYINTTTILILLFALALLTPFLLPASKSRPLLAWLDRKRYQYEVSSSLYMLTSTEKFIFNSLLFLLLAITVIAGSLYLPDHVVTVGKRVYYYVNGGDVPKGAKVYG